MTLLFLGISEESLILAQQLKHRTSTGQGHPQSRGPQQKGTGTWIILDHEFVIHITNVRTIRITTGSLRKCSSRFWDRCSGYHPTQSSSGVALGKTSTNLRATREQQTVRVCPEMSNILKESEVCFGMPYWDWLCLNSMNLWRPTSRNRLALKGCILPRNL